MLSQLSYIPMVGVRAEREDFRKARARCQVIIWHILVPCKKPPQSFDRSGSIQLCPSLQRAASSMSFMVIAWDLHRDGMGRNSALEWKFRPPVK